jgi:hypothetical protein
VNRPTGQLTIRHALRTILGGIRFLVISQSFDFLLHIKTINVGYFIDMCEGQVLSTIDTVY